MKTFQVAALSFLALLLSLSAAPHAGAAEVRILYVNDFHGFAEPYRPYGAEEMRGGIAFLAARVAALRAEKPSLLLAAGDMIQGENWANLSAGESVVELMNAMRFDAMALGNHEFDFGREVLGKRIREAVFPILGANVAGLEGIRPYVLLEADGVKVAVIGVVTDDTPVATHPRNVAGLAFGAPAAAVEERLRELSGKADVFVVLAHLGHQAERALAEGIAGIDVVVGGHSHTKVETPAVIGKTVVVQAWEHGKALGILDLTVENGKVVRTAARLEEIRPSGAPDNAVAGIVARHRARNDRVLDEVIGETPVDLDGEGVRKRETNLGNLVTDAMREAAGAEIAIVNGGDIRTSIGKGPVRIRNVQSVLPFGDYIVAIRLTGTQIREALEYGVSAIEEGAGRFPQVSGLAFTFSPSAPPGSRLREIAVGGKPLEPGREYVVATNDFLAAGGDGYKTFGDAIRSSPDFSSAGGVLKGSRIAYCDASRTLRDVLVAHFRKAGTVVPAPPGRITAVSGP